MVLVMRATILLNIWASQGLSRTKNLHSCWFISQSNYTRNGV